MRAVITVVGKDAVGIIAKVSGYLSEENVNILDISQTIMGDVFTMIMMVDTRASKKPFSTLSSELAALGEKIGVQIGLQNEELFESMHRI